MRRDDDDSSAFVRHEPCPDCGSSDARSLYSDGHAYCFSCQTYTRPDGEIDHSETARRRGKPMSEELIQGAFKAIGVRHLSEDTCRKFDYRVGVYRGGPVQIANLRDQDGSIVAQHLRGRDKTFTCLGRMKGVQLFGQHAWKPGQGKRLIITEGEIDAMSISQLQGNKWPVVSIPNGASNAARSIRDNIAFVESFEEVVFAFDMDDAGRQAVEQCAAVVTPGKAKVATYSLKDASDMLVQGRAEELINAIWNAKPYRPDGIVSGEDIWDAYVSDEGGIENFATPFAGLNEMMLGIRTKEITTLGAGSGVGKSQVCRELAAHLVKTHGQNVGYVALEENLRRSTNGFLAIELNKPLHRDFRLFKELSSEEQAERRRAFEAMGVGERVFLYDHFGSLESDNLIDRIRYLIKGCGCRFIVLDHISIVVSGIDDGDERKAIDVVMTRLRQLVEETGAGIILVSHLKRLEGNKGHEDGQQISLSHFRGSQSIVQLSDNVIGLERNLQGGDSKNITTLRVLKCRLVGETGEACRLQYDPATGRISEHVEETHAETYGFDAPGAAAGRTDF